MKNPEPKINLIIGLLILAYVFVLDVIGMILAFFLLDDFFILDVLTWPTLLYFKVKGIKGPYDKIATVGELLPYLGALPLKTLGVFLVIWSDRYPDSQIVAIADRFIGTINPLGGK